MLAAVAEQHRAAGCVNQQRVYVSQHHFLQAGRQAGRQAGGRMRCACAVDGLAGSG
jgi:hypothetical protein